MNHNKQRKTPALKVQTLDHLWRLPMPPREHLITPWLRQRDSALVFAPTGIGKSLFAMSIGLAIAGGGRFLDWRAPKPRRVLLVDGEMPIEDLKERSLMLIAAIEGIDRGLAGKNFKVMARQNQCPDVDFPDLAEGKGRDELLRQARTFKADLVILDNFSTLATVEDENAASAFNDTIKFLLRLKQAGIACLLVHHSNKSGGDYRGSTKLATTFEVILGLRKAPAGTARQGAAFNISWDKYRHLRDETTRARTVWLKSEDGCTKWHYEVADTEALEELVHAVKSANFATQKELAAHLGISESQVTKLKTKAIHAHSLINLAEWNGCMEAAKETQEEALESPGGEASDFD